MSVPFDHVSRSLAVSVMLCLSKGELPAKAELFDLVVMGAQLDGFVPKREDTPYIPGKLLRD